MEADDPLFHLLKGAAQRRGKQNSSSNNNNNSNNIPAIVAVLNESVIRGQPTC